MMVKKKRELAELLAFLASEFQTELDVFHGTSATKTEKAHALEIIQRLTNDLRGIARELTKP